MLDISNSNTVLIEIPRSTEQLVFLARNAYERTSVQSKTCTPDPIRPHFLERNERFVRASQDGDSASYQTGKSAQRNALMSAACTKTCSATRRPNFARCQSKQRAALRSMHYSFVPPALCTAPCAAVCAQVRKQQVIALTASVITCYIRAHFNMQFPYARDFFISARMHTNFVCVQFAYALHAAEIFHFARSRTAYLSAAYAKHTQHTKHTNRAYM